MTDREVESYVLKDPKRPGEQREGGGELVLSKPVIRRNEAAKPREVLDQEKAEQRLAGEESPRVFRRTTRSEQDAVREDHDQERWLMKDSQEAEINEVRRKADEEKARVQSQDDKKKVDEQVSSRIGDLKKKHEQEKADLEKRQKNEETKAKAKTSKTPVRKKVDKN